jgi:hypothetical protein
VKDLEGTAELQADATYRPQAALPWSHDLRFKLSEGKLRHPLLPLPVDHLDAVLRCVDGHVTAEKLVGRAGQALVRVTRGELYPDGSDSVLRVRGEVEHLLVDRELCERLPERVKRFDALYRPAGTTRVEFDLCRQGGQWTRQHWILRPEGMSACFDKFRYPVDRIRGTLDISLHDRHTHVDLVGYAGSRPVTVRGDVIGEGQDAAVTLDIHGDSIPLDEKLIRALPPQYGPVARSFHLQGQGDIVARVRHTPGSTSFENHYAVDVHQAAVKWEPFPYPVEQVSAHLDIFPDHWELSKLHGTQKDGEVFATGRSFPVGPGRSSRDARIEMRVSGRRLRLDQDFKEAIQPFVGLVKTWNTFEPTGRLSFRAHIDRLGQQPVELDVTGELADSSVKPLFFPYQLHDLSARFHYSRNLLTLADVSARHGESRIWVPRGKVAFDPRGSFYATLTDLQANPLVPDEDLQRALPASLKKPWEALRLQGALALKTQLVVSQKDQPGVKPDIYWDGMMWLRDARAQVGVPLENLSGIVACQGRHNGQQIQGISCNVELSKATLFTQPFHDVHGRIDVYEKAPDVVVLGLKAPFFGGQISGPARLELGSTTRYELDLTASEVDLSAFGRHNLGPRSQLSGLVGGRLHLTGKGAGIGSLEGNGSLDMPKGHLYNLPLLLDLLKFLGLRWPDRTAFEQAHAAFGIHGERMSFSQLELYGNAISLHGEGDMKLDGSDVRLDFIPVWGRIEQVLPAVWQPLPSTIGKSLLKIEVRGKLGNGKDLRFHKKPIPGVLGPLMQMRDRIARAAGSEPPKNIEPGP